MEPSWLSRAEGFLERYWVCFLATLVTLALWEAIARGGLVPSFLLPAPSAIAIAGVQFWDLLLRDIGITMYETLL